ncbi:MAG: hypothetical protein DME26_12040 [Verrucomicrobia bacterium]|nr:MAG: hypothetical protein DME26_12040 [Verrucomicrobiota bacterium]
MSYDQGTSSHRKRHVRKRGRFANRANFAEALNFPDIAAAIDFCRRHGCKGLELLLLVKGAQAMTIPMGDV